ncbi:MAG: nucleoside-diphosphate kinase [Anaerolineae bacterium]|nr:nucleoside-diphosphate kinase [Anaerolineae bacterium]
MRPDVVERTLVLVKPDAVKRGIVGRILTRFEEVGLKIVGLKLVQASREHVEKHYPNTPEWISGMGEKTLQTYREQGKDPVKEIGTADAIEIGTMIKNWNVDYLTSGPLLALVLEGAHAISVVRKMCGFTLPAFADPGTIRGDFSITSPIVANELKRAVRNLVHASSDAQEAEYEIAHWFSTDELLSYQSAAETVMF